MLIVKSSHCWNVPLGNKDAWKAAVHRIIYTNTRGRKGEVDISVSLARVQVDPVVCVCARFYLCADWWNELGGLGNWFWLRLISLFLFCFARWSASSVHSALTPHPPRSLSPSPFLLPSSGPVGFPSLVGSHWHWRLISKFGREGRETRWDILFSLSSHIKTRCLLAQLRHHFWLTFASFILPAS